MEATTPSPQGRKEGDEDVASTPTRPGSLIDTHCHLDGFARRGELPGVLARAREAGVGRMIAVGTDPDDWDVNRRLAEEHAGVIFATAGLHPCSVGEEWRAGFDALKRIWGASGRARFVALGECGLDRFHLPKEPEAAARIFALQREAFAAQLEFARELGCPVVVHSRGAFGACIEQIAASGVDFSRVVFHCFAEGPEQMAELNRRGGLGSFTGILTYKNADPIRAAAAAQGLEKLMLETDAPYLAPVPHRGKPNEPAFVRHTAEAAARLFGVPLAEIAARSTANAEKFFEVALE